MLVNSNGLLRTALKENYAVPAYNINNLEWTRYILEACQEDKSPVILAVSEGAVNYMGGYNVIRSFVVGLLNDLNISIPVVLHLDHGKSYGACKKAIDAGFTSVMIDASSKSIEENIEETIKVVKYAKDKGVSVEAEIGSFNQVGDNQIDANDYSTPDEAMDFVFQTNVDSLAPAIGNIHGLYKNEPKLDYELLGSICKTVKIPLVLHGASGLDENKIKTAIFCGISKININTDIQVAWSSDVKDYIKTNPTEYDPRKIISSGKGAIKKVVHEKNNLFGSVNRAN